MSGAIKPYAVWLTVGHGGKGIPYGGHRDGDTYEDGTANHGFKNLKGRPHLLSAVPELEGDPALHDLIAGINEEGCGLVSIGCASWPASDERGHNWQGYVEFAINSAEMIADARSYFPLFFKFDKMLNDVNFRERVRYNWELEGADFSHAKVSGFTCAVWIHIPAIASFEDAKAAWQRALVPLIPFLGGYPVQPGEPLLTSEMNIELE